MESIRYPDYVALW